MASGPADTTPSASFARARERDPVVEYIRIGIGVVVLVVLVLAGLAFINSFFLEPPAPSGPSGEPGTNAPQPGGGGSGDEKACTRLVGFLKVFFYLAAVVTVVSFALAIVRRGKHQNRIATNPWGILATVMFFASLLLLGLWRIANFVCNKSPNCLNMTNGSYTTYLVLIGLTLAGVAGGMAVAHFSRKSFFATGFGLIGVVLYIPAILSGFGWYIIRLVCSPRLSCATRDQFLSTLQTTFWLAMVGGLVAIFCGILVMRARKLDLMKSGWGVLAIMLIALSMMAGGGWKLAKGIEVPGCDPLTQQQPPTCEGIKSDLQGSIKNAIWTFLIIALLMGGGFFFYRTAPRRFFTSPFAVIGYVLLMLAGLGMILLIFTGSLCNDDEPRNDDDGQPTLSPSPGPSGSASPGPSGTQGPSPTQGSGTGSPRPTPSGGGGTGGSGGGGAGGGSGSGGGSGGSGVGPPQVPLEFGTIPLVWVLVIVGALVLAAVLILLLRHRKVVIARTPAAPPAAQVQATERASLLRLLDNANLRSADAVIAAYRGFLAWCVARGLDKGPEETPREHAERVRKSFPVPEASMHGFIDAYEVARLSTREPTPTERQNAVRFAKDIDTAVWSRPGPEAKE